MNRNVLCVSALGILLVSLIALPVAAQTIPPGRDYWVTPASGQTYFTASLASQQAVTVMKLRRTTPRGGLCAGPQEL